MPTGSLPSTAAKIGIPVKILFVEAAEPDPLALAALLGGMAELVVHARSGREALSLLGEEDCAVVLLDDSLSDMNEIAVDIRSRIRHKNLPVIFVTWNEPERRALERAYALGAVDFVTKPVSGIVLRSKVEALVELRRHRVDLERRIEEATADLRQVNEELADFFENGAVGCALVGPDGIIQRANATELRMMGYAREDYLGRHVAEFHVDRSVVDDLLKRLWNNDIVHNLPARLWTKKGEIRDVVIDASVLWRDGAFVHARRITRDVTDLHRAQEDQARLAAIVESSEDAIIGKTLDGTVTSWNKGAERLLGYTAEEMIGRSIVTIIPETLRAEEVDLLARLRKGQRIASYETKRATKDGRLLDISLTVSPIRDASGRVVGASKVAREVTDRLRAEEATSLLADIVRSSGDAILTKTLDGTITSWNAGAERVFGYKAGEVLGRSVTILIPPDRIREERVILDKIAAGELVDHFESVRRRKDGALIDVSLTISPVRNLEGRIVGASKVARDVTEQNRIKAELRKLNAILEDRVRERTRTLEETIQELNTFSYTVAHDLRAPLRAVHSFGQLIQEECASKLGPREGEYLSEMIRAAGRMDELISGLLAYSRLSRQEILLESIDPGALAEKVLEDMRPELDDRQAVVRVERPIPSVRGHALTLRQALTNLVSNAAKFVAPGIRPLVTIRGERIEKRVRVWVEDNGIGIAPEHRERLFRIFERLQARDAYAGTGIGLAIVRRAIERMGGKVGVAPGVYAGARFWFELDAAAP